MATETGHLRIGELSRRSGVSRELLRAWERRYGLLRPSRSEGGFRLYSESDERRVALMRSHLESGLSAAQAARLALEGVGDEATTSDGAGQATEPRAAADAPTFQTGADELRSALDALDETRAHAALDRILAAFSLDAVLAQIVLPYLRDLGDRWEHEEISVGQEHFATNVLRGRLLGLARGWDAGRGPRAVLACPPGEQHDLGLIAFGLALRGRGWRVTFLGPDTPLDTLRDTAAAIQPDAVVLAATTERRFEGERDGLRRLARTSPLWLAGAGATPDIARAARARLLDDDPVAGAQRVAAAAPA